MEGSTEIVHSDPEVWMEERKTRRGRRDAVDEGYRDGPHARTRTQRSTKHANAVTIAMKHTALLATLTH
jgi:hypothetical protein